MSLYRHVLGHSDKCQIPKKSHVFVCSVSSISHKNLYSEILNGTFRFELSDRNYRNIFGSIFEGSQLRLVSEKK